MDDMNADGLKLIHSSVSVQLPGLGLIPVC
jgi:hypothetical protein